MSLEFITIYLTSFDFNKEEIILFIVSICFSLSLRPKKLIASYYEEINNNDDYFVYEYKNILGCRSYAQGLTTSGDIKQISKKILRKKEKGLFRQKVIRLS